MNFDAEYSDEAIKFLKKADKILARRLYDKVDVSKIYHRSI